MWVTLQIFRWHCSTLAHWHTALSDLDKCAAGKPVHTGHNCTLDRTSLDTIADCTSLLSTQSAQFPQLHTAVHFILYNAMETPQSTSVQFSSCWTWKVICSTGNQLTLRIGVQSTLENTQTNTQSDYYQVKLSVHCARRRSLEPTHCIGGVAVTAESEVMTGGWKLLKRQTPAWPEPQRTVGPKTPRYEASPLHGLWSTASSSEGHFCAGTSAALIWTQCLI